MSAAETHQAPQAKCVHIRLARIRYLFIPLTSFYQWDYRASQGYREHAVRSERRAVEENAERRLSNYRRYSLRVEAIQDQEQQEIACNN